MVNYHFIGSLPNNKKKSPNIDDTINAWQKVNDMAQQFGSDSDKISSSAYLAYYKALKAQRIADTTGTYSAKINAIQVWKSAIGPLTAMEKMKNEVKDKTDLDIADAKQATEKLQEATKYANMKMPTSGAPETSMPKSELAKKNPIFGPLINFGDKANKYRLKTGGLYQM